MIRLAAVLFALFFMMNMPNAQAEDLESLYQPHQGENRADLKNPHRSVDELSEWLISTVGEVFTIHVGTMKQDLLSNQLHFTPAAFKSYLKFLQNSGYLPVMEEKNLNMNGLIQTIPTLDRKGVVKGRYSWIYKVPVTIILSSALDDPSVVLPKPENIELKVQIIRSEKAREPHFVTIIGMVRDKQDAEAPF